MFIGTKPRALVEEKVRHESDGLTDLNYVRTLGAIPTGFPVSQCINYAPWGVWELWKVRH